MAEPDLEYELLLARMKAVEHESRLIMEVVKLQRMRIADLEFQLSREKQYRMARLDWARDKVCRECGVETRYGQVFCTRQCMRLFAERQRVNGTVDAQRGTRPDYAVGRP